MTMATLLLAKTLWWFGHGTSTCPCHTGAFSLNIEYEDHSHFTATDAMKDNYYQHLQLPSIHQGTSILAMRSNGPQAQQNDKQNE